jgi:hypothetical protein
MTVTTVPDPQHPPADCRLSHEPPAAIAKRGWRYHHIGVPTDIQHPGETHLAEYGLYVAGFSTSPYGVEWMRFVPQEQRCPQGVTPDSRGRLTPDPLDVPEKG